MFRNLLILAFGFSIIPASAFAVPMDAAEKTAKADAIIRGVVVDIVQVVRKEKDSRGNASAKTADEGFSGPNAVAVVRVTESLKGEIKRDGGIIFVPCGYNFDESPSELTKTKEYVIFLRSMGANYFHPLDPFSMHRVQAGRVSTSGFDTATDFAASAKPEATVSFEEFAGEIKAAVEAGKK